MTEMTIVIFECHVIDGALCSRDGESLELRFFDPDEIPTSHMLRRYPRRLFSKEVLPDPYFEWDETWLEQDAS